jgi:uncharacterized protein YecE (DUF72 family)
VPKTSDGKASLHIGTSGYQYDHWKDVLYPPGEPKRKWFEIYSDEFDSVEINNTFYNLPNEETFDRWRDAAPPGFLFVLKYSRYGTHMKHLKDPQAHLERFVPLAQRLRSKLGPILVQLPPNFKANPQRLDEFLDAAPARLRFTIELRDRDWLRDEVYEVLRRHNAALCQHDLIEDHPREVTADWVYLRFHGGEGHDRAYPHQVLSAAAKRIESWLSEGMDVYAFFNNDVGGHAVRDARDLRRYVDST